MEKVDIMLSNNELAKKCFQLSESGFNEGSPWKETQFLESFNSERQVAFFDFKADKLVGFIIFSVCLDESDLELICVSESFKRKGIGSQLLNESIIALREMKVTSLFLDVRESNLSAQEFYKRFSFAHIGKRKKYYKNPTENGLVLKLTL